MIPTRRLVLWFAAPVLLTLGYPVTAAALWVALGMDAVLLVVASVDAWRIGGELQVERVHPAVASVGRRAEVRLELHNPSGHAVDVLVHDEVQGEREGLPARVVVEAGQRLVVSYGLTIARRGHYTFGDVVVRRASPWGLWWRQHAHEVPGALQVYPDFTDLRQSAIQARQSEDRAPVRVRRQPGGESEFQRLRHYVPGDAYRHIDWRATARRQRFITREFGQESNQNVIFLLDAGRNMTAQLGDLTAFDHALNAALSMGHAALRHGDRVGLMVFDREVRAWLPPRGGARSGHRLIRGTYDVFPTLREPDYAGAFRYLAAKVRQRSLVVLMTSVHDQVNADLSTAVVRALSARHLPLCVWLRDAEVDALVDAPPDGEGETLYRRGAAADLAAWREEALAGLRGRGALVVDCRPEELSPRLLGQYLEIKARRLL